MKPRAFTTLFLTTLLSGAICLVPNSVLARGSGGRGSSYSSGSHGGSVHVSGYTRSNGTYVAPHTRSASGSGLGHSTGKGYSDGSGYSTDSGYSNNSGESGSSGDPNSASTTSNNFQDSLDSAMSAATLTQSAVSKDDWELVSSKWQNAISLLKQLPNSSPNYVEAQVKIQEYERNLNYARQQLDLPPLTPPEEVATQETVNKESQQNGESLTENEEAVSEAPVAAPLPNTSTEKASSPAIPQATTVTASVSQPPKVAPTSSTGDSNHSGGTLILTILAVIVVVGFSKNKLLPKATQPDKTNPKQEVSNSNFWLDFFSHVQEKQSSTEVERLKEKRLRQKEERLRTEQRLKEERLKQQRLKEERLKEERLRAEQSLREKQPQTEEGFWEKLSKFATEIGNALEGANQKEAQRQTTWSSWGGGGNKVTVKGYQRKDGTYVKDYQRSKHK